MEQKVNVMDKVKMIPENFDGVVRFTNWSDEDFIGKWNSQEYVFPKNTTSPLFIPDASAIELLNICKKFALDLAVREWGKSKWYADSLKRERNVDGSPRGQGLGGAASYTIDQLAPLIQKGLYVYPSAKAEVKPTSRPKLEDRLSKDDEGRTNTKVVKQGVDLERTFKY